MKKIILLICLMIFPLNIKAAEVGINIECDKTVVSPGDTVSCTINGNVTNGEVEGVETTITTSNESQLIIDDIDVDNKVWGNAGTYPTFGLLSSENKTGTFEMLNVTLKVSSDVSGGTVLKLNAISNNFTLSTNEEIKISDVSKEIRVVSSINTLSSLTISNGTLSPTFNKDILSYSATVNSEQITISATPTDSSSTVTGDTGNKSLSYGLNTFKIYVKSESGLTNTYTLSITREKPADTRDKDNTISALTINNERIQLKSGVYEYTYQVESDVTKATVKAVLNSSKATFLDNSGTQSVTLEEGDNKVEIKVKAENEEVKVYVITINRKNVSVVEPDVETDKDNDTNNNEKEENVKENPKTGSSIVYIVLILIIVSIPVSIFAYKKYIKKEA